MVVYDFIMLNLGFFHVTPGIIKSFFPTIRNCIYIDEYVTKLMSVICSKSTRRLGTTRLVSIRLF